jgi:hypothetical protein
LYKKVRVTGVTVKLGVAVAVGTPVGETVVGLVVVLLLEQATATQIKEKSKKLKPRMCFTLASRAFEMRQYGIP